MKKSIITKALLDSVLRSIILCLTFWAYLAITGTAICFYKIPERTEQITLQLIEDDIHTDWVRSAKVVERMERDTIATDTIKVRGDAVR